MTTAKDVLKAARSQIGVTESPANSNKTKYGKQYGWNGVFWCAIFVWWCFWKAKATSIVAKSASAAGIQDETVSKKGGKWIMKKNKSAAERKKYLKKARPGDIVSFDFGAMDAARDHTGLVYKVSGQYVITIEGNTSKAGSQSNGGMVCEQRRLYTSICSAVRPAYTPGTYPCELPGSAVSRKKGSAVNARYWQEFLFWYGYTDIGIDGAFGPETEKYTRKFQEANSVKATGAADAATIAKAKTIKMR